MADAVRVSNPVKIEQTSAEAVALHLMEKIASFESVIEGAKSKREYWLRLYNQCWMSTSGNYNIDQILNMVKS